VIIAVFDTSCLSAFLKVRKEGLLSPFLLGSFVPVAVVDELIAHPSAEFRGRAKGMLADLHVETVPRAPVEDLLVSIHLGEAEAIVMAGSKGVPVFLDDRLGRIIARQRGLEVGGTLAILKILKQRGHIESARPIIQEMLASGERLSKKVIDAFLQNIGET